MTTPNELLEDVKSRFTVLLHDDPVKLKELLRKALTKYQDLAGVNARHRYYEYVDLFTLPPHFLARQDVKDASGAFIRSDVWIDDNELELSLTGREKYPLTLQYLKKLSDLDYDNDSLPDTAVGLIADYLEILITIPNSERVRKISIAGKLDASDIPTEPDLIARRSEVELQMKQCRAITPPISLGF